MTLTEIRLLRALVGAAPQTCSFAQIGVALGVSPDELDKHRIEVIVSRLRSKVARVAGDSLPLLTDRNQGYRWVVGGDAPSPGPGDASAGTAPR